MKIHFFSTLKPAFIKGKTLPITSQCARGREAVPAHATPIAPPPFRRGEVPVFAVTANRWEIRPIAALVAGSCGDPCEQSRRQPKRESFPQTF